METQMAKKHMKNTQTFNNQESNSKTIMSYHLTSIRLAKYRKFGQGRQLVVVQTGAATLESSGILGGMKSACSLLLGVQFKEFPPGLQEPCRGLIIPALLLVVRSWKKFYHPGNAQTKCGFVLMDSRNGLELHIAVRTLKSQC